MTSRRLTLIKRPRQLGLGVFGALVIGLGAGCSTKAEIPASETRIASSLDSRDGNGWTPLTKAAVGGDAGAVADLLRRGANPNVPNSNGFTALRLAAANLEIVRVLLEAGADVNARSRNGDRALAYANAETIPLLLAAGADVNARDEEGRTPLMRLAAAGDLASVKLLLAAGARLDAQDIPFGKTALMFAAGNDHPAVVKALLEAGANPAIQDHQAWTASDYAAKNIRPDTLNALREREDRID